MTSNHDSLSHPSGNRRKKLTTIVFDTDFYMRTPTRMLMKKYGPQAAQIYQIAICWAAYEQDGAVIRASALPLLLFHLQDIGIDIAERELAIVLAGCVEVGFLRLVQCALEDGQEPEAIWISDRLLSELNTLKTKQDNYKGAALAREQAKRTKPEQDSARLTKTKINPAQDIKTEQVRKEQEKEQEQDQEEEKDEEQEQDPETSDVEVLPPDPKPLPANPDDDPANWPPERREAENALKPATHRDVLLAPGFVSHQRRPMKKYPEIWLNVAELMDVARQLNAAGIPKANRPDVFAKALVQVRKPDNANRHPSLLPTAGWLMGFCKREVVADLAETVRLDTAIAHNKKARTK